MEQRRFMHLSTCEGADTPMTAPQPDTLEREKV